MPQIFRKLIPTAARTVRVAAVGLIGLAGAIAVPSMARAQEARPTSHTVKPGDTLWDLAALYLGDPFLWPEIYRLNTAVVEDPHWIYPGEVLRLTGGPNVSAVPPTDTPGIADSLAVADDSVPVEVVSADDEDYEPLFGDDGSEIGDSLHVTFLEPLPPLKRGEFYSSGFLTENRDLDYGRIVGPARPLQIGGASNSGTLLLYAPIVVRPPDGGSYAAGDTLLVLELGKRLGGHGRIVQPLGLVAVTAPAEDGHYRATVIAMFGDIRPDSRLLPAERFVGADQGPEPVTDGMEAQVIGWPDYQHLKGTLDVLFLDKGSADGVLAGDLFEIRRMPGSRNGSVVVPIVMATVQVVRVGEHTATARVVDLVSPDIPAGTPAWLVARIPS